MNPERTRPSSPPAARLARGWLVAGQVSVAAVWLYEGLLAKLLGQRGDELAIVAAVPFVPDSAARGLVVALGCYEVLLACWVLSGRWPRVGAVVQTLTLIAFNTGGLVFAGHEIAEPVQLVVTNASLLVLVWIVATARASLAQR